MTDLNPAVNITVNVGAGTYESIPVKGLASLQPQGSPNSHIPKPTVGRIVHYWMQDGSEEPCAAIVTQVKSDDVVSMVIFFPPMSMEDKWPEDYLYHFSETPKPGHWSWPPRA